MNRKEFEKLWKDNKIFTENRQILNVSVVGLHNSDDDSNICCNVCILLSSVRSTYTCLTELNLPVEKCEKIAKIFEVDNEFGYTVKRWNTDNFIKKYIRLCYYKTPEEDMHELADEYQLVAIKHIINDDESLTVMLP